MNSRLEQFLHDSRDADSVSELFALYQAILSDYGFDYCGVAITSDHVSLNEGKTLGVVYEQNLRPWVEHYDEQGYKLIDPVHRLVQVNPGPCVWRNIVSSYDLTAVQHRMFNEAEDFSLYNGTTLAMHGHGGVRASTVLASSNLNAATDQFSLDVITMASYQMLVAFLDLKAFSPNNENPNVTLSQKEQEVLKWTAMGLTKTQVSDKLAMSAHTVDYHVRNILIKLEARNTVAATAIAIRKNIITV